MIVTKKELDLVVQLQDIRYEELKQKYWQLIVSHRMLLDHLGLDEVHFRARTVLEKKAGPEKPP